MMLRARPRTIEDALDYCILRWNPLWEEEQKPTLRSFLERRNAELNLDLDVAQSGPTIYHPNVALLSNDLLLFSYMIGATPAQITIGSKTETHYARTLADVHIFRPTAFGGARPYSGSRPVVKPKGPFPRDARLVALYKQVSKLRPWATQINSIGKDEKVKTHYSRALTYNTVIATPSPYLSTVWNKVPENRETRRPAASHPPN